MEEDTKADVTNDEVVEILNKLYGLKGDSLKGRLKQLHGYDDLNYHFKPTYSCNPFIKTLSFYGYVLKITNSLDSKKDALLEAQNAMMFHLREHNIACPVPVQTMTGLYYVKTMLPKKAKDKREKEHIIRVLEFQPGVVLRQQITTYSLLYKLGVFLGEINEALKEFSHPFYEQHSSLWHLTSVHLIKSMTEVVECERRKDLVNNVIDKFIEDVLGKAETFEKGMIHGDFNEHNVIIGYGEMGIIDFGDSHYSCYLFELAVALCYMMLECKGKNLDPVIGAGHVLAGYLKIRPKFSADYGLLKLCICARLCQSLVLGLKAFSLQPENNYVMDSQEKGWPLLEELWEISEEKITQDWVSVIQLHKSEDA